MMTLGAVLPEAARSVQSALCHSFRRYLRIRKPDQTFFADIDSIVICDAQRLHSRERDAHVGQESHAAGMLKNLISSFASAEAILQRLTDVIRFELRILTDDVFSGHN